MGSVSKISRANSRVKYTELSKWYTGQKRVLGLIDADIAKWYGITVAALSRKKDDMSKWRGDELIYLFKKMNATDEEILRIMKEEVK